MKQILQSLKTGSTEVADVPCPAVKRGQLLIRSSQTLVSAGTERMLVEFGKANWMLSTGVSRVGSASACDCQNWSDSNYVYTGFIFQYKRYSCTFERL